MGVDSKLELLNTHFLELFDFHAPLRASTLEKHKSAWITDNIKLMILAMDAMLLRKRYKVK